MTMIDVVPVGLWNQMSQEPLGMGEGGMNSGKWLERQSPQFSFSNHHG